MDQSAWVNIADALKFITHQCAYRSKFTIYRTVNYRIYKFGYRPTYVLDSDACTEWQLIAHGNTFALKSINN